MEKATNSEISEKTSPTEPAQVPTDAETKDVILDPEPSGKPCILEIPSTPPPPYPGEVPFARIMLEPKETVISCQPSRPVELGPISPEMVDATNSKDRKQQRPKSFTTNTCPSNWIFCYWQSDGYGDCECCDCGDQDGCCDCDCDDCDCGDGDCDCGDCDCGGCDCAI